jgi:hypothetical protein
LEAEIHRADFVQKQRPAVRRLKQTDFGGLGIGEGPSLITEQFGLQEIGGNRRAVDFDERCLGPRFWYESEPTSSFPVPVSPVTKIAGDSRPEVVSMVAI